MTGVLLAGLMVVLALAAYVDRVYSEMGKFLAREYQDNIDSWEERVEPRLKLSRESIALSASVLRQMSLACVALVLGMQLWRDVAAHPETMWSELAVTLAELVFIILVFDRLVPQVLFARTQGQWVARIRWLLQALFYLILPITLLLGLLLSIAALAEPESTEQEEHPDERMDALLEAGEEEGVFEESDRELVRSVVEFGDKVVREVMTPRPEVFALPSSMTLREFTAQIQERVFSRVPVYEGTLDQVTGIAFAHDLLQVTDEDAVSITLAQIQRPAEFVPETKRATALLREMQSAQQHMRIVIDEYGGVAGVVTIEDLLEAIVGEIADEHDEPEADVAPVREADGVYVVTGTFEVSRLRDLFSEDRTDEEHAGEEEGTPALRLPEGYESTTVGGLVSEIAGHIPLPGEVVEEGGLRLEVLASTDRRIDRIRVSLAEKDGDQSR